MITHNIDYYENGNVKTETWCDDDKWLHRLDGPARINYYENGYIKDEIWSIHNKDSKVPEPYIKFSGNNWEVVTENKILHRIDGPAHIWYDTEGNITFSLWYINGRLIHRLDFHGLDEKFLDELGDTVTKQQKMFLKLKFG